MASADVAASTTLTLDTGGDPAAVFIFNIATTLTMNAGSAVIGNADPCNVFWRVGTSATLNGTALIGTVIADANISVSGATSVAGRLLAGTGATGTVTLAGSGGNTIGGCSLAPVCPIISIASPAITGTVGTAYTQTLSAVGGAPAYTFSLSSGVLPPGLTLTAGGLLSGIPTTAGPFPFTLGAADGSGCPGLSAFTITIAAAAGPPAPIPTPSPGATPTPTSTTTPTPTTASGACPASPTMTTMPSTQTIPVSGSVAVPFSISGTVIADALDVTAVSADLTLVPASAMVITKGVDGARVLTVTGADGRAGVTTITVTVRDPAAGNCTATTSFELRVGVAPVPTLPRWTMIALVGLLTLAGFAAMRARAT
jgi:hypothetical protein